MSADGDQVTLRTADADATVWAHYPQRHAIAHIVVAEASLEEAFLSLAVPRTSHRPAVTLAVARSSAPRGPRS